MAVLNPRLLELIETLTAARLDWLAFELIEGVRAGHPADEPGEARTEAGESIGSNTQANALAQPPAIAAETIPIPPDEQIEWAADYVGARLTETLEQLQSSLHMLDDIVEGTTEATAASMPRAVVVLRDLEGGRECRSGDITGARDSLPTLRAALKEWIQQSSDPASTQ